MCICMCDPLCVCIRCGFALLALTIANAAHNCMLFWSPLSLLSFALFLSLCFSLSLSLSLSFSLYLNLHIHNAVSFVLGAVRVVFLMLGWPILCATYMTVTLKESCQKQTTTIINDYVQLCVYLVSDRPLVSVRLVESFSFLYNTPRSLSVHIFFLVFVSVCAPLRTTVHVFLRT